MFPWWFRHRAVPSWSLLATMCCKCWKLGQIPGQENDDATQPMCRSILRILLDSCHKACGQVVHFQNFCCRRAERVWHTHVDQTTYIDRVCRVVNCFQNFAWQPGPNTGKKKPKHGIIRNFMEWTQTTKSWSELSRLSEPGWESCSKHAIDIQDV